MKESNSFNSTGSSRQSSTISSETGLPRQITIGNYDLYENDTKTSNIVKNKITVSRKNPEEWQKRRKDLMQRAKKWSTDLTLDSNAEQTDENNSDSSFSKIMLKMDTETRPTSLQRKTRKLPDIPYSITFCLFFY